MSEPAGGAGPGRASDPFGLVGTTIADRYRVEALVGEGGFGVIYRGFHTGFERPVAIKCLKIPPHFTAAERETFWRRFREEGKLLARLSEHPSIVRVYDVASAPTEAGAPVPYLVLEWLDGKNLEELLAERMRSGAGPYGEAEALALLRPVVDAMRLAHAHGIAHRDLKPANLFLAPTLGGAALKVLDFGIAKAMQAGEVASEGAHKTSSGFSAFSPPYGAPEQFTSARFGPTGPWTDVHALGLILTELVTGERALSGTTTATLFEQALCVARPTPAERGARPSPAFEALSARALAREPKDRFPDAGALLAALDAVLSAATGAAPTPHAPLARGTGPTPADAAQDTRDFLAAQALDTRDFLAAQALDTPSPAASGRDVPRDVPVPTVGAAPRPPATTPEGPRDRTEPGAPELPTHRHAPTAPFEPKGMTAPPTEREPPRPMPAATPRVAPTRRPSAILAAGALALVAGGIAAGVALGRGGGTGPTASGTSAPHVAGSLSAAPHAAPVVTGPDDTVLVPAGDFTMGCASASCPDDTRPAHPVSLAAFYLDRTEVTVAAYLRCLQAGACGEIAKPAADCNTRHDGRADHPINCVTWAQADAYCRWAGKRLPTEAEWEQAARGTDGRSYPWGEAEPTCERAVLRSACGGQSTAPVGSRPTGAGPYGALDLLGNVREWVADGYRASFYAASPRTNPTAPPDSERVTRGGGWSDRSPSSTTTRGRWRAELSSIGIGMRCARDAP